MPVCKTHRKEAQRLGIVAMMKFYPNVRRWVDNLETVVKREEEGLLNGYERSNSPPY